MSFDSSRFTFDPWKDFSGVVMPQGRVQLDSDWNEWLAELARRIRAGTLDTLGQAVYPATTPNAFLITPTGNSLSIGVGRMYVDGLLVENHGLPAPQSGAWIPPSVTPPSTQPAWDPALDELVGQNPIDYLQQPYFPNAAVIEPFPTTGGPFLVYLDVWQREITFLEYPDLIEKAVGVDTAGRYQTVWQVRFLDVSSAGSVTCSTKDSDIPPWETLIQPSAGRLTTGVVQSSTSGPCCLAPNTGYTGLENQLYRVEIHEGGTSSSKPQATFKWSRDNASVATSVTGISQGGTVLTVQSTGKDSVLRFSPNDWVEVTDDWLELNGLHGELHQVSLVTDAAKTIQLSTPVSASSFPVDANNQTDPTRHTRVIRWDQSGKVYQSDGTTVWTDLDSTGTGEIPVPPPGTSLILENGVTVSFDLNPGTGVFKVGNYWNFAARTIDGTVESLVEAPPRGIHHHYARLAMLTLPSTATDCRVEWPPAGEGGCDCGSCVTAQSHNDGSWTIQDGVTAVIAQGGGKVCLGPGVYNITQTVVVSGGNQLAQSLAICGHGLPTLSPVSGLEGNSIMLIELAVNIDVEGIAFAGGAGTPGAAGGPIAPAGLQIVQSAEVRVERCAFGLPGDTAQLSPAISFGGMVLDCSICDNVFTNVRVGIALGTTDSVLLSQLTIEDNLMAASDGAVFLSHAENLIVGNVRFAKNSVQSASGFVLLGSGTVVTIESNSFAIAAATATQNDPYDAAIVCNISQTRVINNEITRSTFPLTVGSGDSQGLGPGTYNWVVTALDGSGRETLLTAPATLNLPNGGSAQLSWALLMGATGYNIYRTVANGSTFLLNASVAGETGNYTDTTPDGSLTNQLPTMQNDGIVLGSPSATSIMFGTQVTGNRLGLLTGVGISAPAHTYLLETIITDNQMLDLGGNGVVVSGVAVDIDVARNSIVYVALLAVRGQPAAGIQLQAAMDANISENRIENLGPPNAIEGLPRRGIYVVIGSEVRIAGNRVVDIGPTNFTSEGIYAIGLNRLDVTDNEVRRTTSTDQPNQSLWLALAGYGDTVNVQGNLLESDGGTGQEPGTVYLIALQTCTFSNNECFLDNAAGSQQILVAGIQAQAVIAMGNLVQGPRGFSDAGITLPSLALSVPTNTKLPAVTVVGNMTGSGITVNGNALTTPWAPLNILLG